MASPKKDDNHPVYLKNYTLPTPATESAFDTLVRVISKRQSGLVIQGDYRGGKTWFCKYARNELVNEFGNDALTTFWFLCERHRKNPTEKRHLNWMLGSVKYKLSSHDPYDRKSQLHDYLVQEGKKSKRKQIVLIFDEAQELWVDQYQSLMDTYNAIVDAGLTPTFVFIGQPELKGTRETFLSGKQEQMVDRFFVEEDVLRGPRNGEETAEWLKSFGDLSRGIADDRLPFTEHFFPAAWRDGWRLESIGPDLYRCFTEEFAAEALPMPPAIRTKYFFNTVEALFTTFGDSRVLRPDMSDEVLKRAILESRYILAVKRKALFGEDEDHPQGS